MATKIKFTTPFGVAKYPHLNSPDTKGQYADDKWKTKLVCPIGDPAAQAFKKHLDDAFVTLGSPLGAKGYKPYVEDEEAGEITFIAKTSYAPGLFDAKGNAATGVKVGGGSVLRLMGNITAFDKGITCQLNQVQIKELNGFGTCGFDAVDDGYEFDESDAATSSPDGEADAGTPSNGSALDI